MRRTTALGIAPALCAALGGVAVAGPDDEADRNFARAEALVERFPAADATAMGSGAVVTPTRSLAAGGEMLVLRPGPPAVGGGPSHGPPR